MGDLPRSFGPYTLLKSLGAGGSGDVFLAKPRAKNMPSPLVIKRLHGQLAQEEEYVKRFVHEAQIAVHIQDPHVVKVYDVGKVGDAMYIAMEHVAGWTIARLISDLREAGQHASLQSIADIVGGALEGLEALHGAADPATGQRLGIVHRDLAPKNLMVGEDGLTRLIDLGLGKSTLQDWRTGTGVVLGSPGYMAPEQVAAETIDQRTDLYAMGIVLWEFLTLERFIKRGPIPLMLRAQIAPELTPPSRFRADIPPALDQLCKTALALDRNKRFESARAFRQALRAAIPERKEEGPLATLIGSMLWGELGQAKTEITQLIAKADLAPGTTEDVAEVQILAMRPELVAARTEPAEPAQVADPGSAMLAAAMQERAASHGLAEVAPGHRDLHSALGLAGGRVYPGEGQDGPNAARPGGPTSGRDQQVLPLVTPTGARVPVSAFPSAELAPTPQAMSGTLVAPRGVPVRLVGVLMGLMLLAGVGVGAVLLDREPQRLDVRPAETQAPAKPVPAVSASARPVEVERVPEPVREPDRTVSVQGLRAAPVKRVEEHQAPRPAPEAPAQSPRDRANTLMQRARGMREAAGAEVAPKIDLIIGRLAREAASADAEGALERLKALEAELQALSR